MKHQLFVIVSLMSLLGTVCSQTIDGNTVPQNVKRKNETFCYINATVGSLLFTKSKYDFRYGGAIGIGNSVGWQLGFNIAAMEQYTDAIGQISLPVPIGNILAVGPKIGAGALAGKVYTSGFNSYPSMYNYTIVVPWSAFSYKRAFGFNFGITLFKNIGKRILLKMDYDYYLCPNYDDLNHDIINVSIGYKYLVF